jgi:DNA-binding PadR family transcriptional regulator
MGGPRPARSATAGATAGYTPIRVTASGGEATTRRKVSNPLALAILALVLERPMHPYEMASLLRARGKDASIRLNFGALYAVVDALLRHGLIAVRETGRTGRRPERTVYEATDAGRVEFVHWLSELLSVPVKEYPQFEAALSLLPGLPVEDALSMLESRIQVLSKDQEAARSLMRLAVDSVPRLFVIEAEYAMAMRQAELAFTRALVEDIRSGRLGGLDVWRAFHEGSGAESDSAPGAPPPERAGGLSL